MPEPMQRSKKIFPIRSIPVAGVRPWPRPPRTRRSCMSRPCASCGAS